MRKPAVAPQLDDGYGGPGTRLELEETLPSHLGSELDGGLEHAPDDRSQNGSRNSFRVHEQVRQTSLDFPPPFTG